MRGEYPFAVDNGKKALELPPRARRIHLDHRPQRPIGGTTSACAENTVYHATTWSFARNYLRVRGEYALLRSSDRVYSELPPRARRIPWKFIPSQWEVGTTSACAENTLKNPSIYRNAGNYLRVRGEYPTRYATKMDRAELPPRARRIRPPMERAEDKIGTTSACAENTQKRPNHQHPQRNYLRVRGEYRWFWG